MQNGFRLQRLLFLCALLLIGQFGIATRMQGQGAAATILGTVTDPSGAGVPDATITIKNVDTGISQTTTSDEQGRFRAPDLPVGTFELTAMKTGFSSVIRSNIALSVGAQTVVDFALAVGQQQQTVTVEGVASQVETSSTAVANLVDNTQMRELPLNGRNFEQLLTLSPGVVVGQPAGASLFGQQQSYSIAGSRPEGQSFLLDNGDIQNWWNHGTGSGALGTSLGVDSIGEFQVLTDTYSAQFGGNGSVMNAVSKSGTNSFHGSLYEFLRNSDLDARNFFDGASPPPFRRNQFGGTVGGPVKKDKAFFFVNYEGLRQALGQTARALVPDANAELGFLPCKVAGAAYTCNTATNLANVGINPAMASTIALYPTTSLVSANGVANIPQVASQHGRENYLLARFDYNISEKDSIFVRYLQDLVHNVSPFPSNNRIPTWPEIDTTASHFVTLQERHIFGANLINIATFSFNRPNDGGTNNTQTPALNYWPGSGWLDGEVTVSGMTPLGPQSQLPYSLILNKFVESDDIIWTHGAHSFTFGASVNRQQDNAAGPNDQSGQWAFNSLLSLMTNKPTTLISGVPGQYDPDRSFRELPMAFYANDSWKTTSRLTLNIGVRWEPGINPTEAFGNFYTLLNLPYGALTRVSNFFGSNPYIHQVDPRFGFAYDPFKDHKTSIRGGFGIFHDPPTARLFGPCTFSLPPALEETQNNPVYPQTFTGSANSNPPQLSVCDRGTATPYMMQYNLNVQRDIGFGTILSVGYVGSRGVHLGMSSDVNQPISSGNAYGPYASIVNGAFVTNPRPNPSYVGILDVQPKGFSRYDSLQVSLQRRLTNNWQAQLSYTGSHSYDYSSSYWGEGGNISGGAENPSQPSWDLGPSSFNRRTVIVANSVYMLPFKQNRLVSGWQVSGVFSYSSGSPLNITNGVNQEWTPQNTMERPNYVPGCQTFVGKPNEWYNPACFTLPPVGIIGNLGRFALVGPGLVNQDFSVMKSTRIAERVNLQFRAEIFNLFNHPNFGLPASTNFVSGSTPGTGVTSPSAGLITTTVTNSRQVQFGLKLLF
jgi:hypothetical protein